MPIEDDSELGAAPTAITSVVPEQRNREVTQQMPRADPAWAGDEVPTAQTLDTTFPQALPPTPTPRQRARVLLRRLVHEFAKLPARIRVAITVVISAMVGLIIGLIIAPSGTGSPATPTPPLDDELTRHGKRLSMPERDAVVRALSAADPIAALLMLRAMSPKDHLATHPVALALRGRLALTAHDGVDALDNFEAALTADPKLAAESWLPAAAVQTFGVNKIART